MRATHPRAPNPARRRATFQFSTRSGREGGKWREATRRALSPAWALGDTARATITTRPSPRRRRGEHPRKVWTHEERGVGEALQTGAKTRI